MQLFHEHEAVIYVSVKCSARFQPKLQITIEARTHLHYHQCVKVSFLLHGFLNHWGQIEAVDVIGTLLQIIRIETEVVWVWIPSPWLSRSTVASGFLSHYMSETSITHHPWPFWMLWKWCKNTHFQLLHFIQMKETIWFLAVCKFLQQTSTSLKLFDVP